MSDERFKLKIDRSRWARGGGNKNFLLDGLGRQCCVGMYLTALGVPDDVLRGTSTADTWGVAGKIPAAGSWLNDNVECRTDDAQLLYTVNDRTPGVVPPGDDPGPAVDSEEHRERLIAEVFDRHGVDVEFVDAGS